MSGFENARCVGRWRLWDSVDLSEHRQAADECSVCPALAACRELLRQELTASPTMVRCGGGPRGTWAGELIGENASEKKRRISTREHGTDRGYHQHRHHGEPACDDCLAAHAARWHEKKAVA